MSLVTITRHRATALSFALAVITALALLLIGEVSYRRSVSALDDTTRAFDVRVEVERLLRLMVDAESGQRGYLLTGRDNYLAPYTQATKSLAAVLKGMSAHYVAAAQAGPLGDFEKLARLVETKISEMELTITMRREGRDEAWQSVIDSDIGRETQEGVRAMADKLAQTEVARVRAHQDEVRQVLLLSRLGVATMTALSVLAFYFYLRQARLLVVERERQREALQAERDKLELQVQRRTEQLTELARHLQTTQERERSHLARELHDELGALLTSAKLDVARLQSRLPATSPEVHERMGHLKEVLNSGIALKRRIIEDLRPSALSNLGLLPSLDILTREFAKSCGVQMVCALEPVRLEPDGDLTVYRFVQEALTNIGKYAQARRVDVSLRPHDGGVEIAVRDDGRGFDPRTVRGSAHGLVGMRYRVEAERGHMHIESAPGQGSLLQAWLPASPAG